MQNVRNMSVWNRRNGSIILASQSPRRKQILAQLGIEFQVVKPLVSDEESFIKPEDLEGSLKCLADAKAASVTKQHPDALVIGADTIVQINGDILGKPVDEQNARAMLTRLSGKMHVVYTAVAAQCEEIGFSSAGCAATKVFFRTVPPEEIDEYLADEMYADKAGAYAIQGKAMAFVDKIEGCFYNVMGLPVTATISLFKEFNARKGCCDV
ncbi:MAG: septum formation protein Maf [Chitinivibrionales bacterium]|nr:septum formation protein Maf [Chitinivibrionales bacterium]